MSYSKTSDQISEETLQKFLSKSTQKKVSPLNLAVLDNPQFKGPQHLLHLNNLLLQVVGGGVKRLMVFMPPRHAKSETISKYFTAWYLLMHPERKVILCSYEADFAATWGYKSRNVVEEHKTDFNIDIDRNSKARNRWNTTQGGGMTTAGVGGPITGKGGHILIIDDPVKNAEEAQSPTFQEKAWDWYTSTFYTRREPEAAIILIMTRWHEDDLAGRLLRESGDEWTTLILPALAEENDPLGRQAGEALWPERYPREELLKIKKQIGEYWFSALYQQRPLPPSGGLFRREDFQIRATPSDDPDYKIRMWDTASTPHSKGKDPDYTVGLLLYMYHDMTYHVEDVIRERVTPFEQETLVTSTAKADGKETLIRMFRGVGDTGVHQISTYTRLLAGYDFREVREDKAKDSPMRIGPLAAQVEAHNVYLKKDAPWIPAFLGELSLFPHGRHDDQVDALSGAFNELFKDKPFKLEIYM